MSSQRPIEWYDSRADLIWPVGSFNGFIGKRDFLEKLFIWVSDDYYDALQSQNVFCVIFCPFVNG